MFSSKNERVYYKGSNLGNNLKVNSSIAKSNGMKTSAGGHSRRRE